MHLIQENSNISQRGLAKNTDFSLGKVNYCLRALLDIGFIKIQNSNNKLKYTHILISKGIYKKQLYTKDLLLKSNKNTINFIHTLLNNFLCKK